MASWSWAKKSSSPKWWQITTRNWHLSFGNVEISCSMRLPSSSTSSWPGKWRRISVVKNWASWHPGSWAPSWPCRFLVIIRNLTSLLKLIGKNFEISEIFVYFFKLVLLFFLLNSAICLYYWQLFVFLKQIFSYLFVYLILNSLFTFCLLFVYLLGWFSAVCLLFLLNSQLFVDILPALCLLFKADF